MPSALVAVTVIVILASEVWNIPVVFCHRHDPKDRSRPDPVIFVLADLVETARCRSWDVEGGRADSNLYKSLAFPDLVSPLGKPMADENRYVRTGPQFGQHHCLQTHGEPRLVTYSGVGLDSKATPRDATPLRSLVENFSPNCCR
jgi:hypothetical protein